MALDFGALDSDLEEDAPEGVLSPRESGLAAEELTVLDTFAAPPRA